VIWSIVSLYLPPATSFSITRHKYRQAWHVLGGVKQWLEEVSLVEHVSTRGGRGGSDWGSDCDMSDLQQGKP
jgi:hypothetical protein